MVKDIEYNSCTVKDNFDSIIPSALSGRFTDNINIKYNINIVGTNAGRDDR